MYAVIETGGKQYRVEPGQIIDIELLEGGDDGTVSFPRVLLVGSDQGVRIGDPVVSGATVSGVLLGARRGPKIRIFKKKRRKGYRRTNGHRQDLQQVRIGEIALDA